MLVSTIICIIIFWIALNIYSDTEIDDRTEKNILYVSLTTISSIIEQESLPWFNRGWSAGRILMLLWYIFTLIMIFCYNCNFRAMLIAVQYEAPIDNIDDAIDRGTRVYMPRELQELWYDLPLIVCTINLKVCATGRQI